jgi:phage protein D
VPRLHAFRTAVRNRSFPNQTDARVFKLIAGEHGLTPHVSLDSAPMRVPDQKKVSDLAFVLARARALGAEVWLARDELHVHSTRQRPAATDTLKLGHELLELHGTWGAATADRLTRGTVPSVFVAGVTPGTVRLHAGLRVRLNGVGELFEGEYYLRRVTHHFSGDEGLTCAFEAERVAD